MNTLSRLGCVSGLLAAASSASAGILNVTATQGNLSASATFEAQGPDLVVTLSNIGGDVLAPADVLTALFWDVNGVSLSLTSVSAVLASGSSVVFDPDGQPAGGVVGGEWAYEGGLSGAPRGSA